MNEPARSKSERVAVLLAAASLALLALSNLVWLAAYSSLSRRVVGTLNGSSPEPLASITPTATPTPNGTITGTIGYPADTAPAQTVCAASTADSSQKVCTDVAGGSVLAYTLSVPAGAYNVYASLKTQQGDVTTSYKAYYDKFVTCQTANNCAAGLHGPNLPITVVVGQTVPSVDPTDWSGQGLGQ
jgi:hypothetical protein